MKTRFLGMQPNEVQQNNVHVRREGRGTVLLAICTLCAVMLVHNRYVHLLQGGDGAIQLGAQVRVASADSPHESSAQTERQSSVALNKRQHIGSSGRDIRAAAAVSPPVALPRVALLFLARGPLPHEQTWRQFFAAAGELTRGWPQPQQQQRHLVPGQQLFSAYLHGTPGYEPPPGSLFTRLQIDDRVHVRWGGYSVAEAERRLLIAALQDPMNQRFSLLSEAGVVLYPPAVVWLEAMAESRSRINACKSRAARDSLEYRRDLRRIQIFRFQKKMVTSTVTAETFRKSNQWFSLNRKHAAMIAADDHVSSAFAKGCWSNGRKARYCVADEHYIPTLLASLGLDNETDCTGASTAVLWPRKGGPHPRGWKMPSMVTPELIDQLRSPACAGCNFEDAIESAATAFRGVGFDMGWQPRGGRGGSILRILPPALQRIVDPSTSRIGGFGQRQQAGIVRVKGRQRVQVPCHPPPKPRPVRRKPPGTPPWREKAFPTKDVAWLGTPWKGQIRLHAEDPDQAAAAAQMLEESPVVEALMQHYLPMGVRCPLFARKFAASTANRFANMTHDYILAAPELLQ